MDRLKKILGIVIVAAILYGGWTLIPVYLAKYQFEDELANIAKFSGDHSEDQIREEVMKKAKEIGVPVNADNVRILKDSGHVTIDANYTVVIILPTGKQWILAFTPSSRPKDSK